VLQCIVHSRLKRGKVAESEPVSDNVILDLSKKGEILGIEVLGPAPMDTRVFVSDEGCCWKAGVIIRKA